MGFSNYNGPVATNIILVCKTINTHTKKTLNRAYSRSVTITNFTIAKPKLNEPNPRKYYFNIQRLGLTDSVNILKNNRPSSEQIF